MTDNLNRDAFASLMIDALREAGVDKKWRYDPDQFRLIANDHSYIELQHAFDQYCQADKERRAEVLHRWVRGFLAPLRELPEDFADAEQDLMPWMLPQSDYDLPRVKEYVQGKATASCQHRVVAPYLGLGLCFDWPEAIMPIEQEQLAKWGVTFEQALEAAIDNLRKRTTQRFDLLQNSVWVSPYHDNYDAARLVLVDTLRSHPVQGQPVAMVPNRDTLLFTGSDDRIGMDNMLRLGREAFAQPYPIMGIPYLLNNNFWEPYLPDTGHPHFREVKSMWLKSQLMQYASQKRLLDELYSKLDSPVFVAHCAGAKDPNGDIFSFCTWARDVESLLPRTEVVYFFDGEGVVATADWDAMIRVLGDMITPAAMTPPRYHVKMFPSGEQLRLLAEQCRQSGSRRLDIRVEGRLDPA